MDQRKNLKGNFKNFELSYNENTSCQNLWDAKTVVFFKNNKNFFFNQGFNL